MRSANQTRTKLLQTVEQLDRRRQTVVDLPLRWTRLLRRLAVTGAVLVVASAGAFALIAYGMSSWAGRRRRARWHLPRRPRRQPDSAVVVHLGPVLYDLARAVLLPILTAALQREVTPK
jgi:uncharacterized protein (DUF3084 family)